MHALVPACGHSDGHEHAAAGSRIQSYCSTPSPANYRMAGALAERPLAGEKVGG